MIIRTGNRSFTNSIAINRAYFFRIEVSRWNLMIGLIGSCNLLICLMIMEMTLDCWPCLGFHCFLLLFPLIPRLKLSTSPAAWFWLIIWTRITECFCPIMYFITFCTSYRIFFLRPTIIFTYACVCLFVVVIIFVTNFKLVKCWPARWWLVKSVGAYVCSYILTVIGFYPASQMSALFLLISKSLCPPG